MKHIVWITLGWLVLTLSAHAASFDCAKAQSKIEHLICDNPEISKLDEDLSKAYSSALGKSEDKQTTVKEQRQWLNEHRNACSDTACLKAIYISRVSKLSNTDAMPKIARAAAKHAKPKLRDMGEFEPFVKERELLDDPYEFASPEAEKLAKFIERKSSDGIQLDAWSKKMLLENINSAEYLKIHDDIYLVRIGFEIRIADLSKQQYQALAFGYNLEISEQGFLADGTGWVLAHYGGLTNGRFVDGYHLITFFDLENPVYVASNNLVGYSNDSENECGDGVESVGWSTGHKWEDINNDGQSELIFNQEEKNCHKVVQPNIKRRLTFSLTKGRVNNLGATSN